MSISDLHAELESLCIDVNFVRNSRVDITVSSANEQRVREILSLFQYVVIDKHVRDDLVYLRAV